MELLSTETDRLQELLSLAQVYITFNRCASEQLPDPEEYCEAKTALAEQGIRLGDVYEVREFVLRRRQAAAFGEWEKFAAAFLEDSHEVHQLLGLRSLDDAGVRRIVRRELEAVAVETLQRVTGDQEAAARASAEACLQALHSQRDDPRFLGGECREVLQAALHLLKSRDAPLPELQDSLKFLETQRVLPPVERAGKGSITNFLFSAPVGKSLVASAHGQVAARSHEAAAAGAIQKLEVQGQQDTARRRCACRSCGPPCRTSSASRTVCSSLAASCG